MGRAALIDQRRSLAAAKAGQAVNELLGLASARVAAEDLVERPALPLARATTRPIFEGQIGLPPTGAAL